MNNKYNFNITPLSKEEIKKRITDQQIVEYYLGQAVIVGRKYSSPFREDKNPSLTFVVTDLGGLRWRDWGDALMTSAGDAFTFVERIHNCTFPEALAYINRDFDLNLDSPPLLMLANKNPKRSIPKERKIDKKSSVEKLIEVEPRVFMSEDLKYWMDYGIYLKTLIKYDVSPVKYVWIDGTLVRINSTTKPVYAYKFRNYKGNAPKFKIYSPLAAKNQKWLSNAPATIIQGLEQLSYMKEVVVITKSLKDVMVLDTLGIDAIAPQSEGTPIPADLMAELNEYYSGNIICFYDNDATGMAASEALCKQYPIKRMYIPNRLNVKDISDYVKEYGMDGAKSMMRELIVQSKFVI